MVNRLQPCIALLAGLFFGFAPLAAQAPSPLQANAEAVAKYIRADATGVETLFAPSFLAQAPAPRLKALFEQLYAQLGAVTAVEPGAMRSAQAGAFTFRFAKGFESSVNLAINGDAAHSIVGLLIGPPQPVALQGDSWDKLIAAIKALPGQVSFTAIKLGPGSPQSLAAWQPDLPLAIGSAFKLYILGGLTAGVEAGRLHWDQVVPLQAHSLPSGQLQTWPLGTPLTLQSIASLMISISDNTAADQLLRSVGESHVEAMLAPMGNAHASLDQPFLSTSQMFQLKYGDAARRQRYLAAAPAARRALLASLPLTAPPALAAAASPNPTDINTLEWFASASDLCRAMAWFQSPPRATARAVLAINPGIPLDKAKWPYIGFKGGSEPGVISLNFLLRDRGGAWYAVSGIWNNPAAPVSEAAWIALFGRAFALLG